MGKNRKKRDRREWGKVGKKQSPTTPLYQLCLQCEGLGTGCVCQTGFIRIGYTLERIDELATENDELMILLDRLDRVTDAQILGHDRSELHKAVRRLLDRPCPGERIPDATGQPNVVATALEAALSRVSPSDPVRSSLSPEKALGMGEGGGNDEV